MSTSLLLLLVHFVVVIVLICNASRIERFLAGGYYNCYDNHWYPFLSHTRMKLVKTFWFTLPIYILGVVVLIAALLF